MDEVETLFRESPYFVGVVDFEFAVRRHEGGLGGREIGADDLGGGVLVCEIDRPDPRARADVEDFLYVVANWGEVEFVVKGHEEEVVGDVEMVCCLFVVWAPRSKQRSVSVIPAG